MKWRKCPEYLLPVGSGIGKMTALEGKAYAVWLG
jgi:hypothetical protein